MPLTETPLYTWAILPLLIFVARVADVTMGTLRVLFLARGAKMYATLFGFIEVFIWIIVISQVIQNLNNVLCYVAYAGGFAAGTFTGMKLEERLAIGKVIVRIITSQPATDLVQRLRSERIGCTSIQAEGAEGPVQVIFSVIARGDLERVVGMVLDHNPKAFYTVEDVRDVREGVFPLRLGRRKRDLLRQWTPHRKGK